MKFTLVLFFILTGLNGFAQYVPEVDSLLKVQIPYEDPDEGRKQFVYFSVHLKKKYGIDKVREQALRVLTDVKISTENKINFSSLLSHTLIDVNLKKDSLIDLYASVLENNYHEANKKCTAIIFLREVANLYAVSTKNYVKAKSIFEFAEAELKKNQCDVDFIPFYLNISNVLYESLGNTIKAAEYNLKALRVIDSLKKEKKEVPAYFEIDVSSEIASLNYSKGNWQIAITYWKKNLSLINKEGKWKNYLTGAYNNIGIAYGNLKKYDSALYYLNKCIEHAKTTNDYVWIGIATGNIGDLLVEQGNYKKAIPLLEEDVRTGYTYYMYSTITVSLNKLGLCYYNLHNYVKAKYYYDSAFHVFNRWPNPTASNSYTYNLLALLNRNYATLQFAMGKYKEAFFHQRTAKVFDDSLTQILKKQEISSLLAYHDFEQQDTENKLLKAEISEQKLRESRTVIIAFMGCAMIILILALYRLQLSKIRVEAIAFAAEKKADAERTMRMEEELKAEAKINFLIYEQAEEQLLLKERELSSITMHIQQKNEVMSHLKTQLGTMAQKETSLQGEVKSIYKSIRKDLNLNADWNKFKLHFENVHPDFFTKLSTEHPELSLSDLRICAYLRMNMDNNSISQILNTSPDSLRVRKHRLRKRINVNSDKELYSYLQSL